ncbi:MAG TPA: hypothetical protein DD638_07415 [Pasteurellaceae bacterium]|nr:hypothetical protein [Pasteurellaceae bacterium]
MCSKKTGLFFSSMIFIIANNALAVSQINVETGEILIRTQNDHICFSLKNKQHNIRLFSINDLSGQHNKTIWTIDNINSQHPLLEEYKHSGCLPYGNLSDQPLNYNHPYSVHIIDNKINSRDRTIYTTSFCLTKKESGLQLVKTKVVNTLQICADEPWQPEK